MEEYEKFLDRAMVQIPDIKVAGSRFVIPEPKLFYEGRTSVLENFEAIADYVNRDRNHLMTYILRELGTAGKIEGLRAVFQGRFLREGVGAIIKSYVEEFVICSECGRPDTHLIKSERVLMLKCDACGAHRPVKKRAVGSEAKRK